jgi:hypothetical protein
MSDPKSNNDHAILEQSRRAAVQTVANVLDGLAKAKQLRRRTESRFDDDRERSPNDDAEGGQNDFLFDMLRLNATYLNEVARLSGRYRDFAYRVLENMYRVANPLAKNMASDELVFAYDETRVMPKRKLIIQNDVVADDAQALIEVPIIRSSVPGSRERALSLYSSGTLLKPYPNGGDRIDTYELTAPFGKPIVVELVADPAVFRKRKLEDFIVIRLTLDEERVRVRRVPIVLDGRDFRKPDPARERP